METSRIGTPEIGIENILNLNSLGIRCSMMLNEVDRMKNSEDPDQTAPLKEHSDQGLHCFVSPICPNT